MNKKIIISIAILAIFASFAVAQDLKIDYQFNTAKADSGNYFSFIGPIRYMSADKDTFDSKTGASAKKSTVLFQSYKFDAKGKSVIGDGLRGLFLFPLAPEKQKTDDNFTIAKDAKGVITINYAHRGTAYQLVSDAAGKFKFPSSAFKKRVIGLPPQGETPQFIAKEFSADNTAAKIDWNKVWDEKIAAGAEIKAEAKIKTGAVGPDVASADSMYFWEGELQVTFDKNILKINGGLNAVKR